jgi:hypothetical protein
MKQEQVKGNFPESCTSYQIVSKYEKEMRKYGRERENI